MRSETTRRLPHTVRRQFGFTLIELMFVLAIVAMLAGLAYPSFMQSVRKGKRSDALTAMTRAATNLERFFNTNGTYTTDASMLGLNMDGAVATSDHGNYIVTITPGPTGIGTSYVVSAEAKDGTSQAHDDGCTEYSISSIGVRQPNPATSECW